MNAISKKMSIFYLIRSEGTPCHNSAIQMIVFAIVRSAMMSVACGCVCSTVYCGCYGTLLLSMELCPSKQ